LDSKAEIEPVVFTHFWESLPLAAKFNCKIAVDTSPHSDRDASISPLNANKLFNVDELTAHLKGMGFFVVAAGTHADGFVKVYVFAAHTQQAYEEDYEQPHEDAQAQVDGVKVYFVAELKIDSVSEEVAAYVVNDFQVKRRVFHMDCTVKCTHTNMATRFIAEFNFGDIYRLM
jgi:hypothetical protein